MMWLTMVLKLSPNHLKIYNGYKIYNMQTLKCIYIFISLIVNKMGVKSPHILSIWILSTCMHFIWMYKTQKET